MRKELRERVWNKFDQHCSYCGNHIEYKDMQVDHLISQNREHSTSNPIPIEVISSFENLMPSCRRCNHYKNTYSLEQFRTVMMTIQERIVKTYLAKVALDYGIIEIKPFDGIFYFERFNATELN